MHHCVVKRGAEVVALPATPPNKTNKSKIKPDKILKKCINVQCSFGVVGKATPHKGLISQKSSQTSSQDQCH